jgi:hypothetical protein
MGHHLTQYAAVLLVEYLLSALALALEPGEFGRLWKDPGFRVTSFALVVFTAQFLCRGGMSRKRIDVLD